MILKLPKFEETMDSATINEYFIEVGDSIKVGEELYEIETEKFTREVESSVNGTIIRIIAEEGEEIDVGEPVLEIKTEDEVEKKDNDQTSIYEPPKKVDIEENKNEGYLAKNGINKDHGISTEQESENNIRIVPAARMLAKQHNIKIEDLKKIANNSVITVKLVKDFINKLGR
jgi:pyruvate/2-oxoglutarate dehydrogenase complex dihydrolipoamide acyltransferase (E2) component